MRLMKSVRVRTTAAAVAVVGVALVVGAIALVVTLRYTLTEEVRDAAELRADDLVALLESGTPPAALPLGDDDDTVVHILAADGTVLASGIPDDEDDNEHLLFVTTTADTDDGELTVEVGRSRDDVVESVEIVTFWLIVGLPVLLLVVAATTWFVVGRALAPVEAIRSEVDAISGTELHRRVSQPPSEDEIARLAATMNRMLDRLEESQNRQRRFISDASHELRSPVASIRQLAEVALAHPDRVSSTDLAETVLAEDLRVQHLVDDLLLLTRADEHMLGLSTRPVDVDDLVFDEARRLRESTTLSIDTHAVSAGRVTGDARALAHAVRNIGTNAAAPCRVRHRIRAGGARQVRHAHRRRRRTGHPVRRTDASAPTLRAAGRARAHDEGGSGLGLAIVAELVHAHGGTVTIGESPQGGARVVVRMPAFSGESG